MSRVRRAITAFFCSFLLFSSSFFYLFFLERMCAPSFSPNPGCVCVCVCVWVGGRVGGRVDVQARVVYVSVCVCCTHLFSFFTLAFVLVKDLSLVSCCSCFGNAYVFFFFFWGGGGYVVVCFFLLYALVFDVYCRVIPDILSLMFFHVPPLGFLKQT